MEKLRLKSMNQPSRSFTTIVFFAIILLAVVLRFWQLGHVPLSPDWDEVALGYNGYSILHTGHDEYGKLFPIVLRSFDDYKPALYAYLTIPTIAVFGLTVFAVRLPSVLFGIGAVIAVFFLVRELFKKDSLALLSSFLLAISPWHLQFSRIAFESQVGTAFNIFSALLFIKGLKKPWLLGVSALCAALSLYVYQSEKIFTPLLFLTLLILYRKELFALPKRKIVIACLVGVAVALPIVVNTFTNKDSLARAKGVSVFSDSSVTSGNAVRLLDDISHHDILGVLLDNRRVVYAREIAANYFSHFDLNWLFVRGDIERHHAPDMGLMYLWELPFLLIGVYFLLFGSYDKRTKVLLLLWLLLAPVPASVTTGVPHAVRTMNFLPVLQIMVAVGLLGGVKITKRAVGSRTTYILIGVLVILGLFNFVYYLDQYYVQQNYYNAADWQYGYAKVVPEVAQVMGRYKKIVVSNRVPMDQSYMFFLFYLRYDPALYQKESLDASGGFIENHSFGKFEFRAIDWAHERKTGDTLYVGSVATFNHATSLYTVFYPDGIGDMEMVEK